MDSAKNILHSIVQATQRVQNATAHYSNLGVRQVQHHSLVRLDVEFQTIADTSRAVLEVLGDQLLCRRYMHDDSFVNWLSGAEPEACLRTLEEMEKLLNIERENQVLSGLTPARPACEDDILAAIVLFLDHKAHFDFLLTTDIRSVAPKEMTSKTEDARGVQSHEQPPSIPARTAIENQRKEIVAQKLEQSLKFLDTLDCSEKHRQTCSMRQPNTCLWLLNAGEYRSWREGGSFLWLQGKAGAGKTVLASSVIYDLHNTKRDGELLAYFYCDFRTRRSTNAVEVMRSILAQLVVHLCAIMVDPDDLLDELLKESNDVFYNVKGLSRYISKVAALCPQNRVLVVVDALNECREVESLLGGLSIMCNNDIRIFVTSRPLQNIMDSPFQCISMDQMASELSADIILHVERELDSHHRLRELNQRLKKEIRSKLCARADGMFRWVQCQIDALKTCSHASDIQSMLDSLPEGLEETYRRILLVIDRQLSHARIVRRALVWLVTALRPMRMGELLEGLMIDRVRRALDTRFEITGPHLLKLCKSLLVHHEETDIISLSHMSVKEYLVGELVQEKLPPYHIVLEDAHERLARLCMAYIAFSLDQMKESGDRLCTGVKKRDLRHTTSYVLRPLLGYVLSHGFSHLAHLGSGNAGIFGDIETLQVVIRRYACEWDQMCRLIPSIHLGIPWPSLEHDFVMYTLIAFSSDALFEEIIPTTFSPMAETNPLVYAAHFGKTEHARILISRGADVNYPGLAVDDTDTDNPVADGMDMDGSDEGELGACAETSNVGNADYSRVTPLEVAVEHWRAEIIDLLLAGGSTVPDELLARALTKHPDKFPIYIIKLLLQTTKFADWAVTPWNNQPLLEALVERDGENPEESGAEALCTCVQRLVEVGCAQTLSGKTILHIAAEKGYIRVMKRLLPICVALPIDIIISALCGTYPQRGEIVRLLIRHGADVNAFAVNGDTPLHVCIRSFDEFECLRITRNLVEADNNACGHDADDRPPIYLAVTRGFVSVVEYLLSKGVPPPGRILFTATQATFPRKNEMIRLLVRKRADLHILDDRTLLQVATSSVDESDVLEIAKIIVDASHDPSAHSTRDNVFQTHLTVISNHLLSSLPAEDILSALSYDSAPTRAQILAFLLRKVEGIRTAEEHKLTLQDITRRFSNNVDKCLRAAQVFVSIQRNLSSWDYGAVLAALFGDAVAQGDISTVEYLLSQGISLPRRILFNALSSVADRPLDDGVLKMVRLCRAGAQILDANGDNAIHFAVSMVRDEDLCLEAMKILIEAGCNHSVPNATGDTPIQIAVTRGFARVVKYLLSLGIALPPNILFSGLENRRRYNSEMVRSLVDRGADVHAISLNGECLLHVVMWLDQESECIALTKILVDAGCNPSTLDARGVAPIRIALDREFASVVEYLVLKGTPFPRNILSLMFQWRKWPNKLVEGIDVASFTCLALHEGADVNALAPNGDTILHGAIRSFQQRTCFMVTDLILEAGCSSSTLNADGKAPIQLAVGRGFCDVVKYLLSQGAPLPENILLNVLEIPEGRSMQTMPETVACLIEKKADVHARAPDGDTPLHAVFRIQRWVPPHEMSFLLEVVKLLTRAGADVHACNMAGHTPIDLAELKYPEICWYLRHGIPKKK